MTMKTTQLQTRKFTRQGQEKNRERSALQIPKNKQGGQEDDGPDDDDAKLLSTHPDTSAGGLEGCGERRRGVMDVQISYARPAIPGTAHAAALTSCSYPGGTPSYPYMLPSR